MIKILSRSNPEWWDKLNRQGQETYIDEHPNSPLKKYMKGNDNSKGGKEAEQDDKGIQGIHSASDLLKKYARDVTPEELLSKLSDDERKEFHELESKLSTAIKNKGETYLKHTIKGEGKEYTAERKRLHTKILDTLFQDSENYKPEPGHNPKMVLLGGRGGSGKSSFDCKVQPKICVYDRSKFLVLDADAIKEMFKPDGYEGWNAYLYHEESSHLFKLAMARARDTGLNIVLDVTMGSSMVDRVKSFKNAGFDVEAHYMFLPPQKAAERAIGRWKSKGKEERGRLVPPKVILGMTSNEKNFDEVKDLVDAYSVYSNDVEMGKDPIPIASGKRGAKPEQSFVHVKVLAEIAMSKVSPKVDRRKFDNDPEPFGNYSERQKFESYKSAGIKPQDLRNLHMSKEYERWLKGQR